MQTLTPMSAIGEHLRLSAANTGRTAKSLIAVVRGARGLADGRPVLHRPLRLANGLWTGSIKIRPARG